MGTEAVVLCSPSLATRVDSPTSRFPHAFRSHCCCCSSSSDYDSEEERAAARRAAVGRGTAAAAERRSQAELLHAYRARREAREALEEEALRAKLQQQWGLGGSVAAQQGWDRDDGREKEEGGGSIESQHRVRAWLRVLQQHEGRWAALEAAALRSSSCSGAADDGSHGSHGSSSSGGGLTYASVPWPPLEGADYLRGLAAWEQQQQQQQQHPGGQQKQQRAVRRAYARACLRWHPDKFEGRWSRSLAEQDRGRILERVQQLSQGINQAWEALQLEQGQEEGSWG